MDFQFTAAQRELRDRVRRFAESELKPLAAKWDEEERFPASTVQAAAQQGFLGLTLPREYGGSGLGPIESIITIEELAKGCANTAEIVFDGLIGPIQVLLHFGSEALRKKILPKAARGEHPAAIGQRGRRSRRRPTLGAGQCRSGRYANPMGALWSLAGDTLSKPCEPTFLAYRRTLQALVVAASG